MGDLWENMITREWLFENTIYGDFTLCFPLLAKDHIIDELVHMIVIYWEIAKNIRKNIVIEI